MHALSHEYSRDQRVDYFNRNLAASRFIHFSISYTLNDGFRESAGLPPASIMVVADNPEEQYP